MITVIFTSPFPDENKIALNNRANLDKYFDLLKRISADDLCIELSNIMAAKHNLGSVFGIHEYEEKQSLFADLNDRSQAICIFVFGKKLYNYSRNPREINQLINELDEKVAKIDLNSLERGKLLLKMIGDTLNYY